MTKGERLYCSMLVTGQNVVYGMNERGNWTDPCVVYVEWQERTPVLRFAPFNIFSQDGEVRPVRDQHILTTYDPDHSVQENYKQFVNAYYDEMSKGQKKQ